MRPQHEGRGRVPEEEGKDTLSLGFLASLPVAGGEGGGGCGGGRPSASASLLPSSPFLSPCMRALESRGCLPRSRVMDGLAQEQERHGAVAAAERNQIGRAHV